MGAAPSLTPLPGCGPETLATLGPVLCLYRDVDSHVLAGFAWAKAVHPRVQIDSYGPCEGLTFVDRQRRPCWQLYALPDSDYWAWDRLISRLVLPAANPAANPAAMPAEGNACEALRRRLGSPRWRACVLQFHAIPVRYSPCRLAAADVSLSFPGRQVAERLSHRAGARLSLSPYSIPSDSLETLT